ncbi:Bug family tripartite tricarboxylate transporter substrate binding protein [Noviherbaspirillum aerium]|uniref:Bug family tripartite tricarboxylate transporter substrate binding protein n=1 Tax=Noviherbaspirillum aerium TaxID=2588497 RepID=UPI00124E1B1A|nr:tripartite tricarboxylate transporter substrate binding protein [Noviherbaspirillum aerium]
MKISLTRLGGSIAAACIATFPIAFAQAQDYPSKPITLVVPFPPGGATDMIARQVGKTLGDRLGQTVIVENKAGAGTIIGAGAVARANPDGYTLLISSGTTFTVNPAIYAKLPYDPVKNFEPIGIIGRSPMVLLAHPSVPINSFKELVAAAKAAPGKYSYGSYGNGTTAHFAGEMMQHAGGFEMKHLPYKGSAPAMNDLIGGHIPFTVDTLAAALPQMKSGKVKAIAVTTAKRSSMAPQVPSVAENGYADIDADTWLAVLGPRGMPGPVKARLEKALADTLADQETRGKLVASGFEPTYGKSDELAKLIADELPRMKEIAQRANIKLD